MKTTKLLIIALVLGAMAASSAIADQTVTRTSARASFERPRTVANHWNHHRYYRPRSNFYFGVGLGAARYVRGVRSSNTRDLPAYLRRIEDGREATGPTETLDPEARARETVVLMLRRTNIGLARADFRLRTGFDFDTIAADALPRHLAGGLLEDDGRRVRFTREGLFLADTVLSDLL